jgi:hypothetical protein
MSLIEAPALFQVVDAPVGVPYRYGLLSVLPEFTNEDHADLGITWESLNNALALETTDRILDPGVLALTPGVDAVVPEFDPFTAYIYDTDSIAGRVASEHEARARARLSIGEQYGVELAISTRLGVEVTEVAQTLGTEPSEKVKAGIATIEQELGALTGAVGVIHMSRFAATLACDALVVTGGQLRTKLGTPVAAYSGWELFTPGTPQAAVVIFGTGPMRAARGPVETFTGTPDLDTNDVSIIAARTYSIGWDVGSVGVTITL